MLPTNSGQAKNQGCSPVSSNCVVWQGPDLDCIGLCKGDSVSDVVAKLATELCTLIDMFDLSQFDFACLAVPTSQQPTDIGGLIQILIERICALEGLDPTTSTTTTGDCPDSCIVNIADCFYYTNPSGDTITTMTLLEYVTAIGNRICDILIDITSLQSQVTTLQLQINGTATDPGARKAPTTGGIVGDIEDLQNDKADNNSLDYQVNSKTSPVGTVYITDALREVENSLIATQDAVGTPTELYQNILKQGAIGDEQRLYGNGTMSSLTGWTSSVQDTAESIGNLWLSIEDLRQQVRYISENCCSTGCSDLFLNFRTSIAGNIITIFTDGSTGFTDDWKECTGTSKVTITDALGNSTTLTLSLISLIDEPLGYSFDLSATSVDASTNLEIVTDTCFLNTATETQCNTCYTDTLLNTPDCPSTVLTVYTTSVNYQFTSTAGYTYVVNVYYSGGTTPVASQIISTPGPIVIQSIMGLLSETDYDFEVVVVNTLGEEVPCPKQAFTTLAESCQPPINAVAILTI